MTQTGLSREDLAIRKPAFVGTVVLVHTEVPAKRLATHRGATSRSRLCDAVFRATTGAIAVTCIR